MNFKFSCDSLDSFELASNGDEEGLNQFLQTLVLE
jgi:hypothetical protein